MVIINPFRHPDFAFPQTEQPTTVCILPFFHAMGLYNLFKCLEDAVRIVIMRRFEIELFLKTIQDFQVKIVINSLDRLNYNMK